MRITSALAATAIAGALAAGLVGVAGPADAATSSHYTSARTDWKDGARVAAARENHYWLAARRQLAAYGKRYAHESADLTALTDIPLTHTTAKQRATANRATRELDGFFHTLGLYGVATGNAKSHARADWIESTRVSAATSHAWFAAASDELASYGGRFASERAELAALESIPLTSTTAKQRATAHRDARSLDVFFHTPGLNY